MTTPRLTRSEIENIKRYGLHSVGYNVRADTLIALCDLALSALPQDKPWSLGKALYEKVHGTGSVTEEPAAWMEFDGQGNSLGCTVEKPDGFWPMKPLYLRPLEQPKWVSVEERLPDDDRVVWTLNDGDHISEMEKGFYERATQKWKELNGADMDVTFWMELPAAPGRAGEEGK